MADARIIIEGRIVLDPRFNSVNGKSVANLKVLAGRSRKNDDGTWETLSETAYDVAFWNEHAELVNMFNPEKGCNVIVSGTVGGIEKFEGDKGERLSVKVSADGLRVFPKKNAGNNYNQQQSGQSFPAPTGFNQQAPQQQANDPWSQPGGNSGQVEAPF